MPGCPRRGPAARPVLALALAGAALLLATSSGFAQLATGSLEVTGADPAGGPATVRLEREGRLEREVSPDGHGHAWFLHLVPGRYRVRTGAADGAGYEVDVGAGRHAVLALAAGESQATLDGAPIARGRSFPEDERRRTPRPSDPWSLLRDVPGVVVDRVNVGGSETGLQSLVVSHGDPGTGTTWTLDGVDVTDPVALGSTTLFPDMDALSLVEARTGAWDVRVRTPGVQVTLVEREPAGRFVAAAHLRGSADAFQPDNLPEELQGRPFFRNRTERLIEGGAEAGGPLHGGRLWLWGAASRDALRQATFTEHEEELRTTSVAARGRLGLGTGTLTLQALHSEKVHEERDTTFSASPASRWRQSGPTRLFAAEDRHMAGAVSVLSRLAYLDSGFRLEPQGGRAANAFEDLQGVFQGSYEWFETRRPRLAMGVEAERGLLRFGFDHHLLAGAGYRRSRVTTRAAWPGNQVLGFERQSLYFRAFRLTGFAQPTRGEEARTVQDQVELFAQDTARRGRLTLVLGARLDRLRGHNLASSVAANPVFPDLLPAVSFPGTPARIRWTDVLPRVGLLWDLGPGRWQVQAGYAAYAAGLSAADVAFDNPIGREPAALTYFWLDRNQDHVVQRDELDLLRGQAGSSGLDPTRPSSTVSPNVVDPDLRAPRTHEVWAALRRRGPSVEAAVQAWWRRQVDALWRPLRSLTLADYALRGAVEGDLFGEPYRVGYFAPASESRIVPGNGRRLANRDGYHQDAVGLDLDAGGGLGHALQWGAWLGLADWREFFEDAAESVQDPTPLDVEPLQDAGMVAARPGGLGRGDVFVNARWNGGLRLSVTLPWGLLSVVQAHGRDGFPIPYVQVASTGDPTAGSKSVLVSPHLDSFRLPALWLVDARLEKGVSLRSGRLTVGLDAFNVLDRATALQVARDVEAPAPNRPREIVRPRMLRLGIDYRF